MEDHKKQSKSHRPPTATGHQSGRRLESDGRSGPGNEKEGRRGISEPPRKSGLSDFTSSQTPGGETSRKEDHQNWLGDRENINY